ncbi:MAG: OmpA family protein [Crocinitomicaceae bacterium]|nr:OmpA family protein [Crocinitomicaceae bacterium]
MVDYLASKGINKSRMIAKGYGSDRPVASNGTAEGRQENRRTEFEIVCN